MQHLEGSGRPVLYIGRTVLKGQQATFFLACIKRSTCAQEKYLLKENG